MWAAMRYKTLVTLGYTLLALSLCACGPSEAEMHQVILTAYEDMWATDFLGPRRRDDENHIEKVCKPLDQLAEAEFVGKRPNRFERPNTSAIPCHHGFDGRMRRVSTSPELMGPESRIPRPERRDLELRHNWSTFEPL